MNDKVLEAKIAKLEENQKILLAMVTDLASSIHTMRDHLEVPSFDKEKEEHRKLILKHYQNLWKT